MVSSNDDSLFRLMQGLDRRHRVDAFSERLIVRAATVGELLSDDFEALTGQKADTEPAARRLAAWCQSSASGDWLLFARLLHPHR